MNKEELTCLIGKYLNGYKIIKVEYDPFIKGQVNLFTDEWKTDAFYDRSLVVFRLREEGNTSKYYQELVNKENTNLKQALNKIKEYMTSYECISIIQGLDNIKENKTLDEKTITEMTNRYLKVHDNILQIINEAIGDDDSEK